MTSEQTMSFAKAYENLKEIATSMQENEINDIDELIKNVESGTESYKFCKERLIQAEEKLKSILNDPEIAAETLKTSNSDDALASGSQTTSANNTKTQSADDNFDDDIPF